jgi:hypothetical protein
MWTDLNQSKSEIDSDLLNTSALLWIWNPQLKPPHIGISTKGKYFSLRFHKVERSIEVEQITQKIYRSKIPLLLLAVQQDILINYVNQIFKKFSSCSENECSCLLPILQSLSIKNETFLLKDLINHLEENKNITQKIGLNLPLDWTDIPLYTAQDVRENWKNSIQNVRTGNTSR